MGLDPVYMIRDAGFGQDFTPKLWTALVGVLIVVWDVRTQRRLDYLWVLLTGTVLWSGAEAFLAIQGVRDMPDRQLFDRPIGLPLSYLLQGLAEGAFVAVLGLFLADRFLCRARRGRAWILAVVVLALIVASTVRSRRFLEGLPAASRRDILDPRAGLALLAACIVAVGFVVLWREWRRRAVAMWGAMVAIGTVWTVSQVAIGGRWIEVVPASGGYERAGAAVSVLALGWDVVLEIGTAYLAFLAIPVWLRWIRDPTPLPSCVGAAAEAPASG